MSGIFMRDLFCIVVILVCLLPQLAGAQATLLRVVISKSDTPQLWEQAIADFEKQNPGVKVVKEIAPNSSTQFHDLLTQKLKNRDTRLDVFFMDVIWPGEFASAGWALPLDRFFSNAEQRKFLDAPIQANTYRGQIFGVPLFIDAGLLYYRKDLLEKYRMAPPRHWPELVEQAKSILAAERDPHLVGYSGQFKQYEGLVCNMMEYILSNGGALWDEERQASAIQGERAKQAVRFVRDLATRRAGLRRAGIGRAICAGTSNLSPQLALCLEGRKRSATIESDRQSRHDAIAGFSRRQGRLDTWRLANRYQPFFENTRSCVALCGVLDQSRDAEAHRPFQRPRAHAKSALRRSRAAGQDSMARISVGNFQAGGATAHHPGLCASVKHHAALLQRCLGVAR
jgi:hypothetical protein